VDIFGEKRLEHLYAAEPPKNVVYDSAAHGLVNKMLVSALDVAVVYRSNALATRGNVEKSLDVVELGVASAQATQPFAISKESRHKYLMERFVRAVVARDNAERFKSLGFHWVFKPDK
jgi:ABC-type molybdate transport system substrate-binding protein